MLTNPLINESTEKVYVPLGAFLSLDHLKRFILVIFIVYASVFTLFLNTSTVAIYDMRKNKIDRINKGYYVSDIKVAHDSCIAVDCVAYRIKKEGLEDLYYDHNGDRILDQDIITSLGKSTSFFYPIFASMENVKGIYYTDNLGIITNLVDNAIIMMFYILPLVFIMYILSVYQYEKTKIYERSSYKYDIESRLQRNLAESLHHELNQPLALIKDLFLEIICMYNKDEYDKFGQKFIRTPKSVSDGSLVIEYHDLILTNISRMISTLELVAAVKRIKYNDNDVNIYKIIESSVSSTNSLSIRKLVAEYKNLDLLQKYTTSGKLSNGEILNILNILVNNALEAGATCLTFSAYLKYPYMELMVCDNGRGIQVDGINIKTPNDIFGYGVSSKSGMNATLIGRLLRKLGLTFKRQGTVRGAGLSLSKDILQRSGGDIVIWQTNEEGTIFKLTLPVIPIKQQENDAKKKTISNMLVK